MITSLQAEELATLKIQEYVNGCGCDTPQDLQNALLKMLSVTGQAILTTQGQETAVAMVYSTAMHLAKAKFSPAPAQPVH